MKRLILLTLLTLVIIGQTKAQSDQSNELFATGVDLYNNKNFTAAIEAFRKVDKLDKAELDTLSFRRQYSDMWIASCYYKLGEIENAKKHDEHTYHLPPIDRRLTVEIDQLSQQGDSYIKMQDFPAALEVILQVDSIENQLFEVDHHIHIGTLQQLTICYLNLGRIETAFDCIDKFLNLDKLKLGTDSKAFLSDLHTTFFISINFNNIAKATDILREIESIVSHYPEDDRERAELAYKKLTLSLMQRKWDDAHNQLSDYVSVIYKCFGNDRQTLNNCIGTLNGLLQQCGRTDDMIYVRELVMNHDNDFSFHDKFMRLIMDYLNYAERRKFENAHDTFEKIAKMLDSDHSEPHPKERAVFECMKCVGFASEGNLEEAKQQYIYIQENAFEQSLENSELEPIYQAVKANMSMLIADYEGCFQAYDKIMSGMTEMQRVQNLNVDAMLACSHAFAGNYGKAKEISKTTANMYRKYVVDTKALYRLDKDTMQLNQTINIISNLINNNASLPDSAIYALRDIKCEYINLKADILKNLDRWQFNYDYLDCITDMAYESILMRKYIEAQEIMSQYLTDWEQLYKQLQNSEEDTDLFDRILAVDPMSYALYFRSRFCYEKGDPATEQAHQDNLRFVKWDQGEDSKEYKSALMFYYMQTDNNKQLIALLAPQIEATPNDFNYTTYEALSNAYKAEGDMDKYIKWQKESVNHLLMDPDFKSNSTNSIWSNITNILNFYFEEKIDTTAFLQYYQDELWPAIFKYSNQYVYDFLHSIDILKFKIDNNSFVSYIEDEMSKRKEIFTPGFKTCVNVYIASVLSHISNSETLAQEYIDKAYSHIAGDNTLEILLDCYKHQILHRLDDRLEAIKLGNELMDRMRKANLIYTHEYTNLVSRQLSYMNIQDSADEIIQCCNTHLSDFSGYSSDSLEHVFNTSHPRYSELGFLNETILRDVSFDASIPTVNDYLYKALSLKDSGAAKQYATKLVKKDFDGIQGMLLINYVSRYKCDKLISLSNKLAFKHQLDSLNMYAYDALLLCKGLQLRSDHAVRALIKKSGHRSALRKYNELEYITRLLTNAPDDQVKELENKRESLQSDLNRLSRYFGDYTKSLYTSWKDVQSSLGDNDIAIEFAYVTKDYDDKYVLIDTTYNEGYYACILRKGMKAPKVVYITDNNNLATTPEVYTDTAMSRRLISPLLPYLDGVSNIYFSPIGVLNQISLESLPMPDNLSLTFSSQYSVHRLSSTRELINNQYPVEGKDAVVYGGLAYDTSIDYLKEDARKYPQSRAANLEIKTNTTSRVNREGLRESMEGITYLGGTKIEAENVASTINSVKNELLHADIMLGDSGTETAFKSLDGAQKRVIHIATHGFYYNKEQSEDVGLVSKEKRKVLKEEDTSLMRSGLLMAGAENRLMMEEIPEGLDDGILTSQEIANLDLTGLDLCVLSACETAQGDVSSEGVFGLQRGFKKAGAKSLLMSLWKVDDDATCHLMTEFYSQWIGHNKSKHEALELAKQSVRSQKERGWDAPRYWAAFILLDD